MFLLLAFSLHAQMQVRGTVKDNSDELLPGCQYRSRGTSEGTVTDADGRYSLAVPDQQSVLVSRSSEWKRKRWR